MSRLTRRWFGGLLSLTACVVMPHSYYVGAVYNAGRIMPRLNAR